MSKLESRAASAASSGKTSALRHGWVLTVGLGLTAAACGLEGEPDPGSGGNGGSGLMGSSGTTAGSKSGSGGSSAGVSGSSTTGGTAPTAGTVGNGGSVNGGATSAGTGGKGGGTGGSGPTAGTGGTGPIGGTGGAGPLGGSGGKAPTGGTGPTGGMSGTGGTLGGTTGGSSSGGASGSGGSGGSGSGTCQKGTTMGNEVLFIGESFIAASEIPEETTKLARAAGSLAANDSYVDRSVSGTWIGNGASNSIPNQYRNNANGVRFVLMNGGGNDCWQGGQQQHRTAALNAASELFQDMAENGVEKIVYFFYPDPIGSNWGSLTACLDLLRPEMQALCEAQTSPQCFWVDLRETWDGHPEYAASDGIHVGGPGSAPTAAAIFESMQENCVAP